MSKIKVNNWSAVEINFRAGVAEVLILADELKKHLDRIQVAIDMAMKAKQDELEWIATKSTIYAAHYLNMVQDQAMGWDAAIDCIDAKRG